MKTLEFKPKQVAKRLITEALSPRSQDIMKRRYGIAGQSKSMTLEAIGKKYGITRERVRQIENHSLKTIRESDVYGEHRHVIDGLEEALHNLGTIVAEHILLDELADGDQELRNHLHFLLTLGHPFEHAREDEHFTHRWHADKELARSVEQALHKLYTSMPTEELLAESEVIDQFLNHLKDVSHRYRDEEILKRWLSLSKKISRNELGQWGTAESPMVNPRGIRDYAYLTILDHGSPLHFKEVAERIRDLFKKRAHVATTHNELIKDSRFVLVGRGLYALSEWGYAEGVVRDVIRRVLKENGPLSRDKIIEKVLTERYVKPNTVLVNLQDTDNFKRLRDGRYTTA